MIMASLATNTALELPPAGALWVSPDFMDLELVDQANRVTDPQTYLHMRGFVWMQKSPEEVTAIIENGDTPEPLCEMAQKVADALPFVWSSLSFYIRHIGTKEHTSSVSIHSDNDKSMRVLIEGGSAKWVFDQEEWTQQYPNGLLLRKGTAAVLNNLCDRSSQLRHGVTTELDTRTSYLFNFYK